MFHVLAFQNRYGVELLEIENAKRETFVKNKTVFREAPHHIDFWGLLEMDWPVWNYRFGNLRNSGNLKKCALTHTGENSHRCWWDTNFDQKETELRLRFVAQKPCPWDGAGRRICYLLFGFKTDRKFRQKIDLFLKKGSPGNGLTSMKALIWNSWGAWAAWAEVGVGRVGATLRFTRMSSGWRS